VVQPVNGGAFALQIANVLRIAGHLDCDNLAFPNVMARFPDLAEAAHAYDAIQNVFADPIACCWPLHAVGA